MSLTLAELAGCFEGVIPSIIATAAADGTPNISYLSHVVQVDAEHIALSNQFFAKTAANIRANPQVTLILVDAETGEQFLLDVSFVRAVESGPLFQKLARDLATSSALLGLSEIMRLKTADIFRVKRIEPVPSPVSLVKLGWRRPTPRPAELSMALRQISGARSPGPIIDNLLASVENLLGHGRAMVLTLEPARPVLRVMGSRGYDPAGLGAELAVGEGIIGAAAESGQAVKVSDLSRIHRFGQAIRLNAAEGSEVDLTASHPLSAAMSQIALPLRFGTAVLGVLYVESPHRLAFRVEDEAVLDILASHAAVALQLAAGEGRRGCRHPGKDAQPFAADQRHSSPL